MKTAKRFSKKVISVLLTVAMLLSMVLSCITITATAEAIAADTSWYVGHESDSEYTLTTAAQLLGFDQLAQTMDFVNKTIRLGNDIDLNPGWSASLTISGSTVTFPSAPANVWTPIPIFGGNIDGQGHVIKGFYSASSYSSPKYSGGIFKDFNGHASDLSAAPTSVPTIENLAIVNSTFIGYGSVATVAYGGIAGWMEGQTTIQNCYFDINTWMINYSGSYIGGLVGRTGYTDGANTFSNCVVAGTVGTVGGGGLVSSGSFPSTSEGMKTAGILGEAKYATIEDCLVLSSLYYKDAATHGSVYAAVSSAGGNSFADNYVGLQASSPATGWVNNTTLVTYVPSTTVSNMLNKLYSSKTLVEDASISTFDPLTQEVGSSYLISTAADLKAFNALAQSNTFEGFTVKLGADIDLNTGWDATVTVSNYVAGTAGSGTVTRPSAAAYSWAPIPTFAGTFNGQGHVIRGLYISVNNGTSYDGIGFINTLSGTVRNVAFVNGYIYAKPTAANISQRVGTVAGQTGGALDSTATIENVFCDTTVILHHDSPGPSCGIGGILGRTNNDLNNVVSNCVFDGKVMVLNGSGKVPTGSGNMKVGGIIGFSNATANGRTDTVSNCLMTGNYYYVSSSTVHNAITNTNTYTTLTNCKEGKQASSVTGWNYVDGFASYVPSSASALVGNYYQVLYVDSTIANYDIHAKPRSSFVIASVSDLLSFREKVNAEAGHGANYTFKLTADLNLNPGWNAVPSIDSIEGTVAFASAPGVTWGGMPSFCGTFDGQNHYIAGIYRNGDVGNWGYFGGFADRLYGTVENIRFVNSLVYANCTSSNARVGGIAGITYAGAGISDVYADIHVWYKSSSKEAIAGIIAHADTAITLENIVFAGTVGNTNNGSSYPGTSTGVAMAQCVADPKGQVTLNNSVFVGTLYHAGGASHCVHEVYGNGIDTVRNNTVTLTNVVVGKYASVTAANNSGSIENYNDGTISMVYNSDAAYIVPSTVNAMGLATMPSYLPVVTSILNYAGTEAGGTTFTIGTVKELLAAANLSQAGVTFDGYTLKLTANIDLNPGWNADVTVNAGSATLPVIPAVRFPGFATFKGTFDGQNHTINGVFVMKQLLANSANLAMFEVLSGATIKNLKIGNSLIFAEPNTGVTDCKIGGLAARTKDSTVTIKNCYFDIDVWYRSFSWQRIAGVIAKTDTSIATLNNVVFAGVVGTMCPGNAVPSTTTSSDMAIAPFIADGNWKGGNILSACDYTNATFYQPTAVATINPVAKCDSTKKDNINNTTSVTAPAAASAWGFNLLPTATTDSKTASYEADTQSRVYYYEDITAANYEAYISTLQSNGYTLDKTYYVGGNRFDLLQNGVYSVYTSYLYGNGTKYRARVSVTPYGGDVNTVSDTTAGSVTPMLWQLNIDNWYSKEAGGMGYIIRLSDGKFIVVDGGYASDYDATNIYKILCENNVNPGKPVIAAWFITHLHNDHYGALEKFSKLYANKVTVEGFYFNFPTNAVADITGSSDNIAAASGIYAAILPMNSFAGAKLYEVHTGMKFGFADAIAQILCTQEDACQSYYVGSTVTKDMAVDGNDTSVVIKFHVGGQDILITGDASEGESQQMSHTWTDAQLKSDIVQVAHHGFSGLRSTFYASVDADVALWPQDIVLYEKTSGDIKKMNNASSGSNTFYYLYQEHTGDNALKYDWSGTADQWIRNNSLEVIPAFENVCLTLPYTAKTYSGGNKTVNISTVYKAKSGLGNEDGGSTAITAGLDGAAGARAQYVVNNLFTQSTAISDGKFSLRFLAGFSGRLEDFDNVGIEITVNDGSNEAVLNNSAVTTVYTSVMAAGKSVTAAELGFDYLYGVELRNIPETANLTITLQAYRKNTNNEKVDCYGTKTIVVSVSAGTVSIK